MARRTLVALACSLVLAGSLTAFSSDSQSEAESAVCTSIASVKTAADGVRALDSTSTVNEVEAARKALVTAIDGLKSNAADLNTADLAALEAAGDEIAKAAAGVSGSATLGEAADTVKTSSTQLWPRSITGVQCN